MQVIAILEHLNYESVSLVGTSGGAWVAIHAALERADLIECDIADSFDGRRLHDNFASELVEERTVACNDPEASLFYEWCQGTGWKEVVSQNTAALLRFASIKKDIFHKPLTELKATILFIGSKEDEMTRKNLFEEYKQMVVIIPNAAIKMFDHGAHPAILSNAEEVAELIHYFKTCSPLFTRKRIASNINPYIIKVSREAIYQ